MDDDVTPPAADTPDSTPTQKIDAVMAALAQAQTMLVQHGDALDVAHMNDGITSMLYDLQIMQAEQSNALVSTDSQEPDLMSVSSADSGSTAEDLDSDDPDEVFTLTADGQSHSVAAADTPSLRLAAAPLPVTGTIQFAPQRTPVSGTLAVCFIALQWKDGYGEKLQTISNLSRQAAQVYAHLSNNLIKFNKCR